MANVLAAIAGAASGIANAIAQQKQYNMMQVLQRAQLASMGAQSVGSAPDPNDPTAPSNAMTGGSSPISPAAAMMSGATPSTPLPPPNAPLFTVPPQATSGNTTQSGTVGSMVPSSTGNLTQSGVGPQPGNTTQSGTSAVPTDQASVINMARQAQAGGVSGGNAAGSNGGGVMAALAAAQRATATPGISGTPTPADPIGGVNSGLDATLSDYQKAMAPKGSMALGNGMTMPVGVPPQQAQMLTVLAQARIAAAQQAQQQNFLAGQATAQRGFEGTQQANLLTSEDTRTDKEIASQQAISSNQLTLEGKRLDQQHDQMMAMLGFKTTKQTTDAQTAVLKDVQPIETQIAAIQHAQQVLQDGTGNPADVSAGTLAAWSALGPAGKPRMNAAIAQIAGGSADESIPAKIQRIGSMVTSGKLPAAQTQMLQSALSSALTGYQQQWQQHVTAGVLAHPEAPDLAGRFAIRQQLVAGGGSLGANGAKPDPIQFRNAGKSLSDYNNAVAAWTAGQSK